MARKFEELRAKMSPEQRARVEAGVKEAMAEMLIAELRKHVGLTQEQLAESLGIKQPTLSRLESQDDMQSARCGGWSTRWAGNSKSSCICRRAIFA